MKTWRKPDNLSHDYFALLSPDVILEQWFVEVWSWKTLAVLPCWRDLWFLVVAAIKGSEVFTVLSGLDPTPQRLLAGIYLVSKYQLLLLYFTSGLQKWHLDANLPCIKNIFIPCTFVSLPWKYTLLCSFRTGAWCSIPVCFNSKELQCWLSKYQICGFIWSDVGIDWLKICWQHQWNNLSRNVENRANQSEFCLM